MEFKRLLEEKNRLEILKSRDELTQEGLEILSELTQSLQLQQTGVSWRSEQLVSFLQWYIKDDMVREKKELIKSVVERYLKETNCH